MAMTAAQLAQRAERNIWKNEGVWLVGKRVELHPGLDRWMMGDKYGKIVKLGLRVGVVSVKLDRSGKTMKFQLNRLTVI